MTYKTHIAGGFLIVVSLNSIGILQADTLPNFMLLYGLTLFGSLLPDIDHPTSFINKFNPLSKLLCSVVEHRTITHSLIFPSIIALIVSAYGFNLYAISGLCIGILSHLILDTFTPTGVPWLYPHDKKYSLRLIRTNGEGEKCLLWAMIGLMAFIVLGV